ncbi:MAG: outer membrane protein assembly factor BamD [Myxococcales bacterium]|nr:outer membrane protein assembly factor BamD [Myxococcales bacterium]MCB9526230.1 outer membrane protein assembly factor BamD [Myxococcales bacterium]
MLRTLFMLVPLVASLVACGGSPPPPSYAGTARHRYEQGKEALDDEDYLQAVKHFTFVKNKFAYSKYAALAEVGMADAYFQQSKYIEAIDAYRTFVQSRPNHRLVPYAMWRIGVAYHEQVPSDFVLFPPSHEKDLGSTKDALRALQRYVERFPQDEHIKDARGRIVACRTELADHEMYVAGFYLTQDRPRSAKGRLEKVVAEFEDVPSRWRRGAWLLVKTHLELAKLEPDEARAHQQAAVRIARQLIEKAPRSDEAAEARNLIGAAG